MNVFANDGINEYAFLDASEIPFDAKNREYCKADLCGRYGKTWNCPPAVGTFEECKAKAQSFSKAFVFTHCGKIDDFSDLIAVEKLRCETMEILYDISTDSHLRG